MKLESDTFYTADEVRSVLRDDLHLPMFTTLESRMGVAWLAEETYNWNMFAFNVRIGDVVPVPADFMPSVAKAVQEASQKRVDIIAIKGRSAAIVEVKVRAAIGALGQVLGYATIWQAENPTVTDVQRIVVAGAAMLDVPALLQAYGVTLREYRELWLALGSPSE
jgi:hypothetical protein